MKIFINPGHCIGIDPGAVGNGLVEAEVALNIGRLVEKYLQAVGFTTKLFQYDGLRAIAADANNWGADLFISIHCNAAANSSANGTETFYWNAGDGKKLASKIHNQIVNSIKVANRNIKTANFTVLGATNMPAVLVETAFITNPYDAKLLTSCQDDFARAIARGVTDYTSTYAPLPPVDVTPAKGIQLSKHFHSSEFTCHHCGAGANKISRRLIELLEQLRSACGDKPLHINSGYRCPTHNANVGGVVDSQHVKGTAADVAVPAGMSFDAFARAVESLPFDGIGYYVDGNFIHVDTRNGGGGEHITWAG